MPRLRALMLAALASTALACASATGDPCTDDASCGDADFVCQKPGGAPAGSLGVCTRPFKVEGESCLSSDDCASDLYCTNSVSLDRQFAGSCAKRLGAGAACRVNRDCAPPATCKSATASALGSCG